MDARTEIISKLRRQIVDKVHLPEVIQGEWIQYPDPVAQFSQTLAMVGGECSELDSIEQLPERLGQLEPWRQAENVFSQIPQVPGNIDVNQVEDPHLLENLDFVIYPGQFAVAENGAVWLTDRDLRHRVVFFITQYLVLVVPKAEIISNMHAAYARAVIPRPGFGLFLSGPSKTADIEQSLVVGAHGCRELQVFLV